MAGKHQKFLNKGDAIPLDDEHNIVKLPFGDLEFSASGTNLTVTYHYVDGTEHKTQKFERDLHSTVITIGTGEQCDMQLPKASSLSPEAQKQMQYNSKLQASISLDVDDLPEYVHLGTNPIANPYYEAPKKEMVQKIMPEAKQKNGPKTGSGAGFTHENAENNPRTSNEDRALATHAVPLTDKEAVPYLEAAMKKIVDQTHDHPAGSTLTTAMRTRDGNYACSYLGDSPIFTVIQHEQTGNIELLPMGIPHNILGSMTQKAIGAIEDFSPPNTVNQHALREFARSWNPEFAEAEKNPELKKMRSVITHKIGRMGADETWPATHIPETIIINTKNECPQGYRFKGVMVCSDGIDHGVDSHKVQDALTALYQENKHPTPQELSKTAVMAAKNDTNDNVTAMMLPSNAKAGDLIAVADGNTGSADVAQSALKILQEHCHDKNIDAYKMRPDPHKFVPLVTKKGNEYRISLQGSLISTEEAKPWLNELANVLKQSDPEHAYHMSTKVIRQTLTVKNPGTIVKASLDKEIRAQEARQSRGGL